MGMKDFSGAIPCVNFNDRASDSLPLPPLTIQHDREADGLLVYSSRAEIRSSIQQILQGIEERVNDYPEIDKSNRKRIQTGLRQISRDGTAEDLFEATMDFLFIATKWIDGLWSHIESKKDLRLLNAEQSRLEQFFHLVEQSPKRSRAVILAITKFVTDAYWSGYNLSEASITWSGEGSRPKVLHSFVEQIKRWKTESERLSGALNNDGRGLLACIRDISVIGTSNSAPNSVFGSDDEEAYDSEDLLGLRNGQDSESEGNAAVQFNPPSGSQDPEVWHELNNLIGLEPVKRHLFEIIATVSVGKGTDMPTLHLMLSGNPGVGKTTVARLYGRILKDLEVLPGGQLEEQKMSSLSGKYVGESENQTREAIERAQGGVLFIDEVHQLCGTSRGGRSTNYGFGKQIIDTIMPEMENLRSSFVVIFATYSSKVEEFFDLDPGLRRRVSETIEFPDYSNAELAEILEGWVKKDNHYQLEPGLAEKVSRMLGKMRGTPEFANAGSVRNAYEKAQRKFNARVYKQGIKDNVIRAKDFAFLEEWVAKARKSRHTEAVAK
jgi:stage V sporulation protein K